MKEEKNLQIKEKKNDLNVMTAKKIDDYIKTFLTHKNLQPNEIAQFKEVAIALNLNPFKKELHVVAYGQGENRTLSIITGYEVYLRRADEFPQFDGFETEFLGEFGKEDFRCKITIYRNDRKHPTVHEVYFTEVAGRKKEGGLTKFWIKQPRFQLKKCAIAQGMRLAFPNDFDQMPYVEAEMENFRDVTNDYTDEETDKTLKSLDQIKKAFIKKKKSINIDQSKPEAPFVPTQSLDDIKESTEAKKKLSSKKKETKFAPATKKEEILERARAMFDDLTIEESQYYVALKDLPNEKYTPEYHEKELKKIEELEKNILDGK
jgi:phage recombination protein Bet